MGFVVAALGAPVAYAEESYDVSGENALALADDGSLTQSWRVACTAVDVDVDAHIVVGAKDLRAFSAPDQALEVGVDGSEHGVDDAPSGQFTYDTVVGARVFARLSATCGTSLVNDAVVVDSAAVTVPPQLEGPVSASRLDTLAPVLLQSLPRDVEVQLEGVRVLAQPFGDEVVEVAITGSGVEQTLTFGPADVDAGAITFSPVFTPTSVGQITLTARFLDTVATPLAMGVLPDSIGPDEPPPELNDASCRSSQGAAGPLVLLGATLTMFGFAGRRRRPGRQHR